MAKEKQEDNRDVFDKALDLSPVAVGTIAGGLIGRRAFRKVARKNLPDGPRGVRPGDKIITDEGVKTASKRDAEMFKRMDNAEVSRAGRVGATLGGATGFAAGGAASNHLYHKRRK